MKELSDAQLTFLKGFAYLTSLAYFENPSSCNYSIMKTFASYMVKDFAFFISCVSFLSAHSKTF